MGTLTGSRLSSVVGFEAIGAGSRHASSVSTPAPRTLAWGLPLAFLLVELTVGWGAGPASDTMTLFVQDHGIVASALIVWEDVMY
jgi:hypothetical protein